MSIKSTRFEKLGYHALIDFSKLPFAVPTQGIVAGKEFVRK